MDCTEAVTGVGGRRFSLRVARRRAGLGGVHTNRFRMIKSLMFVPLALALMFVRCDHVLLTFGRWQGRVTSQGEHGETIRGRESSGMRFIFASGRASSVLRPSGRGNAKLGVVVSR